MKHSDSISRKILAYVKVHPGCSRKDILTALPADTNHESISSVMHRLKLGGAIENRGGAGTKASWYAVEIEVSSEYLDLAEDLLKEIASIDRDLKIAYLAKRLEELMAS